MGRITKLPDAGPVTANDWMEIEQGGAPKRISVEDLVGFMSGGTGAATWGDIDGNIEDQTDLIAKFGNYQLTSEKNNADGYAGLDSSGKIYASQLPALAITDTYVVASQAAMLALDVETGDIAVRTDETKTYILKGTDPTDLADWEILLTPTAGVISVFGRTGAVTAASGDYSFSLISGTAAPTQGGTGLTSYTTGDLLYASATNVLSKRAAGTNGYVLTMVSGLPAWAAAGGGGGWSLTGNAGTVAGTNFMGTTDDVDVLFKRNNQQQLLMKNSALHFGLGAGSGTTGTNCNMFGVSSGFNSGAVSDVNFFGQQAGQVCTGAGGANMFGRFAGANATNATQSNFFGHFTGQSATNASYSNFIGGYAGGSATNAQFSNFIGYAAGSGATGANYANAIGQGAGQDATNAAKCNLIGYNAGRNQGGNNIGQNNIIIGTNISLPNATANAINLGGVLFGVNTYNVTTYGVFPSVVPQAAGRIGIGIVTPATCAILDLTSTNMGFLPPRMDSTQKAAISSKVAGLIVYDSTLNQMSYYNGTTWINF